MLNASSIQLGVQICARARRKGAARWQAPTRRGTPIEPGAFRPLAESPKIVVSADL